MAQPANRAAVLGILLKKSIQTINAKPVATKLQTHGLNHEVHTYRTVAEVSNVFRIYL